MGFNSSYHTLSDMLDGGKDTYSVRAAAVYCAVLSLALWWVPILGPAVAGYVCGRKTGSVLHGLVCSFLIGIAVLVLIGGLSQIFLVSGGYPAVSAGEAATSLTGVAGAIGGYLQYFFYTGTSSMDISALGVLVMFGGVGGIMSSQARKEVADILSIGAVEGAVRPAARTMDLYKRDKELGFECFNDYIMIQGVMTNVKQDETSENTNNIPKGKRPTITVQTVTTTVTGDSVKRPDRSDGPFVDILQRAERRKSEKK